MLAAFPVAPPATSGKPTTGELVRILQYLMACAQSHQSNISRLNLLYVCIPEQLYHHYNDTNELYPRDPVDPGPIPIVTPEDNTASHCNIRVQWEYGHKRFKDVISMNTSLLDCLLSLIAAHYKAEFTLKRYSDLNMNFKLAFQTSSTMASSTPSPPSMQSWTKTWPT